MLDLKLATEEKPKSQVFVRKTTSCWGDSRGLHTKVSLNYLKRRCKYHNFLEEEADTLGGEAVKLVQNLMEVPDGVYEVIIVAMSYDWETGLCDDWEYKLVEVKDD